MHSVLITPSSPADDPSTSVVLYQNEDPPRQALIKTVIPIKFFQGFGVGVHEAQLQGFALINAGTSVFAQSDVIFSVVLNLAPLPSAMPSMVPSQSIHPTLLPTSGPIIGLADNIDVWGKCLYDAYLHSKPESYSYHLIDCTKMNLAGCQCNEIDRTCMSSILTQFNNVATICIFSTRPLKAVENYRIRGDVEPVYNIIEDGTLVVDPEMFGMMDIDGTQDLGVLMTVLPQDFFQDMDSVTTGRAMIIVSIVSASGSGSSEVGLYPDLQFWYAEFSDPPTISPKPTTAPPTLSALPSQLPSLIPSGSPSTLPTRSSSPTAEKNTAINACHCQKESFTCTDEPVAPTGSRRIAVCLISEPQTFIYGDTLIAALTQQGAADYLIVTTVGDVSGPVPNTDTTIEESGERRRIIQTTVPEFFFDDPTQDLIVTGFGTIIMKGSDDVTFEMEFSAAITLASQPSEAPSSPPSESTRPTFTGPTVRPTISRKPSASPSESMMPTDEQTISLSTCKCDAQNSCLPEPVVLTSAYHLIRICLLASPSNAEITSIPGVIVKGKNIPLEKQLDGNFGVISGELNEEDFEARSTLNRVTVVGKAEILVEAGNKRSEVGFREEYEIEPLTMTPTDSPTTSLAPTDLPPLGARACQCNTRNVCVENVVQTYSERAVRICITSTPPQSELVQIEQFFFEDENSNLRGTTQSVVVEGVVQSPSSDNLLKPNNKRLQVVLSELDDIFFQGDISTLNVVAKGVVVVKPTESLLSQRTESLETYINSITLEVVQDPTSSPTMRPTTANPTDEVCILYFHFPI